LGDPTDESSEGLHHEGGSHHNQQVALGKILLGELKELVRQLLAKENYVWLHQATVLVLQLLPTEIVREDGPLDLVDGNLLACVDASSRVLRERWRGRQQYTHARTHTHTDKQRYRDR